MSVARRVWTLAYVGAVVLTGACGAPPQRLVSQPTLASRPPRLGRDNARILEVVAFTTSIAPGTSLGGQFDDDGGFKMRIHTHRMFPWSIDHECAFRDALIPVLEEAGFVAVGAPDCWVSEDESTLTDRLLIAARLDEFTLNTFCDPGRVDVEVMVFWELLDGASSRVLYESSTYGFASTEGVPALMLGGTAFEAAAESLRRVLADPEFAHALTSSRDSKDASDRPVPGTRSHP